jgi:hypothetical protein
MTKIHHVDFVEKIKNTEILDLLYCMVEAHSGKHIDIITKVPADIIMKAETELKVLINYCQVIAKEDPSIK